MNTETRYQFIPNLNREIAEALKTATPEENIRGRAVYADSLVKILLFPFAAGQVLEEHVTPHPATLHVLEGTGEITLGSERKAVAAGSWVWMQGELPHSIRAETKLILLLQVFLQPSAPTAP